MCLSVTQRQLDVFLKTPQSDLKALCSDPVDPKNELCVLSAARLEMLEVKSKSRFMCEEQHRFFAASQ